MKREERGEQKNIYYFNIYFLLMLRIENLISTLNISNSKAHSKYNRFYFSRICLKKKETKPSMISKIN